MLTEYQSLNDDDGFGGDWSGVIRTTYEDPRNGPEHYIIEAHVAPDDWPYLYIGNLMGINMFDLADSLLVFYRDAVVTWLNHRDHKEAKTRQGFKSVEVLSDQFGIDGLSVYNIILTISVSLDREISRRKSYAVANGSEHRHSLAAALVRGYRRPQRRFAFDLGQKVRIKKCVLDDGQTPRQWAGSYAVVAGRYVSSHNEHWYMMCLDNLNDHFNEFELDMRCIRKSCR